MVLERDQRHVQENIEDGYSIKIVYVIPESPGLTAAKLLHHKTYNFSFAKIFRNSHWKSKSCLLGHVMILCSIKVSPLLRYFPDDSN
jgi:hypothetical protein